MSACTCTNYLYVAYTSLLGPSVYPINQDPTFTQPQQRPAATQAVAQSTVTLSGEKLAPCSGKSCHPVRNKTVALSGENLALPRPDSNCLKTSNRRLTYHLASMHQISELLSHHFPPTTYRPTTSSRALTIELLECR